VGGVVGEHRPQAGEAGKRCALVVDCCLLALVGEPRFGRAGRIEREVVYDVVGQDRRDSVKVVPFLGSIELPHNLQAPLLDVCGCRHGYCSFLSTVTTGIRAWRPRVGGQAHRGRGRADGEVAAVEVQDGAVGSAGNVDGDDRHTAQPPGGGDHFGGHRRGGDHLVEQRLLLTQVTRRVERRRARHARDRLTLLLGHESFSCLAGSLIPASDSTG